MPCKRITALEQFARALEELHPQDLEDILGSLPPSATSDHIREAVRRMSGASLAQERVSPLRAAWLDLHRLEEERVGLLEQRDAIDRQRAAIMAERDMLLQMIASPLICDEVCDVPEG